MDASCACAFTCPTILAPCTGSPVSWPIIAPTSLKPPTTALITESILAILRLTSPWRREVPITSRSFLQRWLPLVTPTKEFSDLRWLGSCLQTRLQQLFFRVTCREELTSKNPGNTQF